MTHETHSPRAPRASIWQAWHDAESALPEWQEPTAEQTAADRLATAERIAAGTVAVCRGEVTAADLAADLVALADRLASEPREHAHEVVADWLTYLADRRGLSADDLAPDLAAWNLTPDEGEYWQADETMMTAPAAPFPTTHDPFPTRPHAGRTIRGRRVRVFVVGSAPAGWVADDLADCDAHEVGPRTRVRLLRRGGLSYTRGLADDLVRVASSADGVPALIGTDDYAWSQMVHHRPATYYTVTDGLPVLRAHRPAGAGASVVGQGDFATSKRRKPARVTKAPTYTRQAAERSERTDADGRVWRVSHLRTTHDGRTIVAGTGRGWEPTTRAKRTTAKRAKPATIVTREAAADLVAELAKADGAAWSVRYVFADGTAATVTHEPTHRRWRVAVSVRLADGTRVRQMTTTRKIATAADRVRTAAASA